MQLEDDHDGWFDDVNDELSSFLQEDALVDAIQSAPQAAVSNYALESPLPVASAVRAVAPPSRGGGNARGPDDVEAQDGRRFDGQDGPFTKAEFMEYYDGSTVEWDTASATKVVVDAFDLLDDAAPVGRAGHSRSVRRQLAREPLDVAATGSEGAARAAARRNPAAWQNVAKAGLLALAAIFGMFTWGPSLWSPPEEKLELARPAAAVQRLPRIEFPPLVASNSASSAFEGLQVLASNSSNAVHGQRISGQIGVQLRDGDNHHASDASEEALKSYNASLVAAPEPDDHHGESSNVRGRQVGKRKKEAGEDEIRFE